MRSFVFSLMVGLRVGKIYSLAGPVGWLAGKVEREREKEKSRPDRKRKRRRKKGRKLLGLLVRQKGGLARKVKALPTKRSDILFF